MFHKFRLLDLKPLSFLTDGALVIALLVAIGIAAGGCRQRNKWHKSAGAVWNTTYTVTYEAPRDLSDSIQAVFREIDNSLSVFNKSSLVTRINNNDSTALADMHFRRVFDMSVDVNRRGKGLFDPTVAPLVNLWKFGNTGKVSADSVYEPSRAQIDSALAFVGLAGCSITPGGRVVKKHPATSFNFSAVAKGYACDVLAEMLRRNGSGNVMVEIGGEVTAFGHSPRGDSWRLQIDCPVDQSDVPTHEAIDYLEITDCGVATSGNYRNYHESSFGRVGHTIDPMTGYPRVSNILSATVIAPDCAHADAWATAVMAAPTVAEADSLLRVAGLNALIITSDSVPCRYRFFRVQHEAP